MFQNGANAGAAIFPAQSGEVPQLPNEVWHGHSSCDNLASDSNLSNHPRLRPLYSPASKPQSHILESSSDLPPQCSSLDLGSSSSKSELTTFQEPDLSNRSVSEATKSARPAALRRFSLISRSLTSLIAANVMQGQQFVASESADSSDTFQLRACNLINRTLRLCVMNIDGRFRLIFDVVNFVTIIVTILFAPIQVLFQPHFLQNSFVHYIVYMIVDIIFGASIVINILSTSRHRGILESEPIKLFLIYSKYSLAWNILLLIPYDFLTGVHFSSLFRVFRVSFIFIYFTNWLRFSSIHHIYLRLLRLIILLVILVHCFSCAFSYVFTSEQASDSYWLPEISIDELITDESFRYLVGCHWGFNGVLGHLSAYPHTTAQIILTFFMNIVGLVAHALIFSSVASMVQYMLADTCSFTELISSVNSEMQSLKLPSEMQIRIRNYFIYHNERFNQKKESGLMSRLPSYLQMELSIHLNSEVIKNVPFFAHADQSFALQLSKVMTLQVCLPGEYIIRQGDIGTEMYFLTSGSVEVSTGATVHKVLTSGQFFGEMALIEKSRRTANVRALTYCDFLVLCKRDLDSVLEDCPEIKRSMVTLVHNRKVSNSFQSQHRSYSLANVVTECMAMKKAAAETEHAVGSAQVLRLPLENNILKIETCEDSSATFSGAASNDSTNSEISVSVNARKPLDTNDANLNVANQHDPKQAANNHKYGGRKILKPLPIQQY
jgi:CRP-like cAMP-binding protein